MSKVLIIYASHYGQTRAIAMRIAEYLHEQGAQIDVVDTRQPQHLPAPDGYDLVVLGSRVEIGRHAAAVAGYITTHRQMLERIPTGFFSVSMAATGGGTDPNGYLDTLFTQVRWKPTRAVAIGGGLPYRKYGWFTRFIMKRISKAAGHTTDTSRNHELTRWDDVRKFSEELIALLPAQVVARPML